MGISRRRFLGAAAATGAAATVLTPTATLAQPTGEELVQHRNSYYYKDDGTFDVAKAKEAYYDLMRHYVYPIPDRLLTDEFWAVDFGLGEFTEVGLGGILWINHLEHKYFGHEIYLLPGQMIAEHQHLETAAAGPKLEGWHVRHGWIYIYGEGEPTEGVEERIPESQRACAEARTERILKPGETASLGHAREKHWMRAGPEGAIVTEYATYHDGAGLRFSHPDASL